MSDQPTTLRPPDAVGLYDPRDERDACGVGFVVDIKGRRSHGVVEKGLQVLINLLHRGACGCEANTGDGAGILIQTPDRFLRKIAAPLGITLPAAGQYGTGLVFLPRHDAERAQLRQLVERIVNEEGQRLLGWRMVPTADGGIGESALATKPVIEQIFIGAGGAVTAGAKADPASVTGETAADPATRTPRRGTVPVRAEAVRHPQADRARGRSAAADRAARVLHPEPVVADADLQRDADCRSDRGHVPRSARSRRRVGAGAGPPALQHQHVPVVAAGAPLPLRRAQRGDQHAARQHQLDARARRTAALGPARRRSEEDPADHPRGRQRYGDLRQRARIPGDDRAIAAARHPDDDPRAVGRPREHAAGAEGVLRVPLVADGAVGRSGVDRVHRRPGDRRDPGPQRAAAVALLRHQGRPRHHGVRGRRARHPGREHPDQGAPASGPDLPDRHRAGPHRLRRRDQARSRGGQSVRRSGWPRTWWTSKICRMRRICRRRPTRRCCSGSRRSATRTRTCASCWRRWPTPAKRRSARWAPTPRWRCCRTGRACSTTISSSCSRR